MKVLYLTEGYLGMTMVLTGTRTRSTIPQEERVHG